MVEELVQDNLGDVLKNHHKMVVLFSASWCGNCKIMKPKFKKLASENESIKFVIVDAEQFPNSRKLANVDNLPTFAIFENSVLINQVQTNKLEPLEELVNEILIK